MDIEKEEKEIRELMRGYRWKDVPEPLLKDYVADVRRRIHAPEAAWPGFPWLAAALVSAALLAAALFLVPTLVRKAPAPSPARPAQAQAKAQDEEALFDRVSKEAFILEMLGEDQGLMEDAGLIQTEVNVMNPGQL